MFITDEEIREELGERTEAERRYWERKLDEAMADWYALEDAEELAFECGELTDEAVALFQRAFREVSRRANEAYDEWIG